MSCTPKGDEELAVVAGYCLANLRLHIREDKSYSVVITGKDRGLLRWISEVLSRRIGLTDIAEPRWFPQYRKGSLRFTRKKAEKILDLLNPYMGHVDRLGLVASNRPSKPLSDPFEGFTPPKLPWE